MFQECSTKQEKVYILKIRQHRNTFIMYSIWENTRKSRAAMFSLNLLPYSYDIYHILRVDTPTFIYFAHLKHLFNSGLNEHRPHDIYYLILNSQTSKDKSKQNKANMLFYWMQIRFQI